VAGEGAGAVWAWSGAVVSAVRRQSRAPSERVGVVVIEVGSISNMESLFGW